MKTPGKKTDAKRRDAPRPALSRAPKKAPEKDGDATSSDDDRETILRESTHMADRDQVFGKSTRAVPGGGDASFDDGWSEDLEEDVKGERSTTRDAVDDFARIAGADEERAGGGDEDDAEDEDAEPTRPAPEPDARPATMSADELRRRAGATGLYDDQSRVDELRTMLEARARDLIEVIAANEKAVIEKITPQEESQVDYNHPADMVEGPMDFEKNIRLVERERAELVLVKQAMHRLDEGEYGVCEACAADIGIERLRAIPYAKYCIECQSKRERRDRAAGVNAP